MDSSPVGMTVCTKHLASVLEPESSALEEISVLDVPWIAGVRDLSRPPSSVGESSCSDWASHGNPAVIVGAVCLTLGVRSSAKRWVGPKEACSGPRALSAACRNGGSSEIVVWRGLWRGARAPPVALKGGPPAPRRGGP